MAVKLKDLTDALEKFAPLELMESYDNPGLAVGNPDATISKVLIAFDLTLEVIEEAKIEKADLILTHHPLLFMPPDSITSETVAGNKIIELISNGINAYSLHTNIDKTKSGMNDELMSLLGFNKYSILDMGDVEGTGVGRVVHNEKFTIGSLAQLVKEKLKLDSIRFSGDSLKEVNKIAVINGSGAEYADLCVEKGVDVLITGDTKYHSVLDALERGLAIIDAGHFNTEWIIFQRLMDGIFMDLTSTGLDFKWILSKTTKDVYSYK